MSPIELSKRVHDALTERGKQALNMLAIEIAQKLCHLLKTSEAVTMEDALRISEEISPKNSPFGHEYNAFLATQRLTQTGLVQREFFDQVQNKFLDPKEAIDRMLRKDSLDLIRVQWRLISKE